MKQKLLNNWQLKLVTLVFAFVFWRMVDVIADPITTKQYDNISVTMLNEELVTDEGMVYQIENTESTVSVTVRAESSVLREISSADIIATANFEEIELSELIPVRIEIDGFEGQYIEASVSPVNLIVQIENSASKKFPIVPLTIGSVTDGYALGDMTVVPETITISGPESIVNSISRVAAQVNLAGVTADTELEGTIICYDDSNQTIDQGLLYFNLGEEESVMVDVQILDTKTVDLTLDYSGEPASGYRVVSLLVEPTSVVVAALQEVLDEIDIIEIPSSALDITGESGKVERVIDVSEYLPEGVQLYDKNSNSIAVTIQIDKLGTKSIEIPVQSIIVNNNPSGLSLSYDSITEIMITLTALENVIDEIDAADVQLSIDLKGYSKAGEYDVEVTMTTDEDCELLETVTVPIILKEN